MSAAALLEALAAAGRALEAGDALCAAEAMDRAQQATAALRASATGLTAEELARARALHAACRPAIDRCRAELNQALELTGRSLRAAEAYRR